jgi:predicted dinucleotide-binding enzyme
MKIGILGTGTVGRLHAEKLVSLGHNVMLGTRSVEKTLAEKETDAMGNPPLGTWLKEHPRVQLDTFEEACRHGELLIDVLKGEAVLGVFSSIDKKYLDGKVIIDIANVLDFSKGMPPILLTHDGNSLAEQLQKILPDTLIVKTLNTVSAPVQVNPLSLADGDHHAFMSGNDAASKKKVEELLRSYGWKNIIDLGDITTARGTELMLPIWLRLWGALGTASFNYKIVK